MQLKTSGFFLLGILASGCFRAACAPADTNAAEGSPHAAAGNRDVVHLDLTVSSPASESKAAGASKLALSGFYKVGSKTRVLMVMPPKDQESPAKYYNLGPGEKDGSVEVVKINAEKGEVEILNSGKRMTLSLLNNGVVVAAEPNHPVEGTPAAGTQPGSQTPLPKVAVPVGGDTLPAAGKNSPIVLGGGDSSALLAADVAPSYGGAIGAGRNVAGAGNSSGLGASGIGSSPYTGGVIVGGGNPAGTITIAAGGQGGVYVPPNPGSVAANEPGANVGAVLENPQNSAYKNLPSSSSGR